MFLFGRPCDPPCSTVYRGMLDRLGSPALDEDVLQATYDYVRRLIASDKIRTKAQVGALSAAIRSIPS